MSCRSEFFHMVEASRRRKTTASAGPGVIAICLGCAASGVAAALYPRITFTAAAAIVAFVVLYWLIHGRMRLWQALTSLSLAGFIVFNYGFENLIVGHIAGVPILVGEFLMLAGLLLAMHSAARGQLQTLLRDPIVHCLIFLLCLAALHLIVDVPRFGLYAFRDASVYFEAAFLIAGYLWANESNGVRRLIQCLLVIFALNAAYSFTLPWSEGLQDISPKSGVFQPVALLGQYQQSGIYLIAGALLCAWIADYAAGVRRRLLQGLAILQICGLAVVQSRATYVGTVIILAVLFLLAERSKLRSSLRAVIGGLTASVLVFGVISILGVSIHGRVGDINGEFLRQYALSVLSIDNSHTRLAKDEDRLDWFQQVWRGTTTDEVTFLLGQGFGLPLIDFEAEDGMPVRQPHNAAAGVFGRLGLAGLSVWLVFQVLLFKRFLRVQRAAKSGPAHDLILWLLAFYIIAFVLSMTQPALEFSHCAVPFFFVIGFALRLMGTVSAQRPQRTFARVNLGGTIENSACS